YSGVISVFCNRLLKHLPIDVFGDGTQTRDFIYVDDVITSLLRAMDRTRDSYDVLNVCTGAPTSIVELAQMIGDLCGWEPQLRFGANRVGEIRHSRGDPTLMRHRFGVGEPIDLRSGLKKTLCWTQSIKSCQTENELRRMDSQQQ